MEEETCGKEIGGDKDAVWGEVLHEEKEGDEVRQGDEGVWESNGMLEKREEGLWNEDGAVIRALNDGNEMKSEEIKDEVEVRGDENLWGIDMMNAEFNYFVAPWENEELQRKEAAVTEQGGDSLSLNGETRDDTANEHEESSLISVKKSEEIGVIENEYGRKMDGYNQKGEFEKGEDEKGEDEKGGYEGGGGGYEGGGGGYEGGGGGYEGGGGGYEGGGGGYEGGGYEEGGYEGGYEEGGYEGEGYGGYEGGGYEGGYEGGEYGGGYEEKGYEEGGYENGNYEKKEEVKENYEIKEDVKTDFNEGSLNKENELTENSEKGMEEKKDNNHENETHKTENEKTENEKTENEKTENEKNVKILSLQNNNNRTASSDSVVKSRVKEISESLFSSPRNENSFPPKSTKPEIQMTGIVKWHPTHTVALTTPSTTTTTSSSSLMNSIPTFNENYRICSVPHGTHIDFAMINPGRSHIPKKNEPPSRPPPPKPQARPTVNIPTYVNSFASQSYSDPTFAAPLPQRPLLRNVKTQVPITASPLVFPRLNTDVDTEDSISSSTSSTLKSLISPQLVQQTPNSPSLVVGKKPKRTDSPSLSVGLSPNYRRRGPSNSSLLIMTSPDEDAPKEPATGRSAVRSTPALSSSIKIPDHILPNCDLTRSNPLLSIQPHLTQLLSPTTAIATTTTNTTIPSPTDSMDESDSIAVIHKRMLEAVKLTLDKDSLSFQPILDNENYHITDEPSSARQRKFASHKTATYTTTRAIGTTRGYTVVDDPKKGKFLSLRKKGKVRPKVDEFQISSPSQFRKEENAETDTEAVGGGKAADVGILEALKVAGKQSEILQEENADGDGGLCMKLAWKALNELVSYVFFFLFFFSLYFLLH
jgi:hypothetical protein